MNQMTLEGLKYPIGKFTKPVEMSAQVLQECINDIANFPQRIKSEVENLSEDQFDTPYREGGWSVRQLIHHCADSHMNSLVRCKLALTEDQPTIKPYYEDRWAELVDSKNMPIAPALKMLEGIHERWTFLLQHLTEEQLKRSYIHPEQSNAIRIDETIGMYAWHCNHHLAHIIALKERMGW